MDLLQLQRDKKFLGQEFLTWLWCLSENEPSLKLPDGRQVEIVLGDRLALGPIMGQEGARVSLRGAESGLAEARAALHGGKLVDRLRLGLIIDGDEYWLSLDSTELAISALRTPAMAPAEGGRDGLEALVLERIALLDTAVRAVDGLYAQYLTARLADEAGGEPWEQMRSWATPLAERSTNAS